MIGLDIKYSTGEMECHSDTLPIRESRDRYNKEYLHMADSYFCKQKKKLLAKNDSIVMQSRKFWTSNMNKLILKT